MPRQVRQRRPPTGPFSFSLNIKYDISDYYVRWPRSLLTLRHPNLFFFTLHFYITLTVEIWVKGHANATSLKINDALLVTVIVIIATIFELLDVPNIVTLKSLKVIGNPL